MTAEEFIENWNSSYLYNKTNIVVEKNNAEGISFLNKLIPFNLIDFYKAIKNGDYKIDDPYIYSIKGSKTIYSIMSLDIIPLINTHLILKG